MRKRLIIGSIGLLIILIWALILLYTNTRQTEDTKNALLKTTDTAKKEKTITKEGHKKEEIADKESHSILDFGSLYVTSDPQNAEVLINNTLKGLTPIYLKEIPTGNYRITASLKYHLNKTEELTVEKNTTNKMHFKLVRGKGKIAIRTKPADADVRLDGKKLSKKTPLIISKISSGKHTLEIHKKFYYAKEVPVEVLHNQTLTLDMVLDNMPAVGRLFVHTNPREATVRILNVIDRFKQGMKLPPDKYHVEVSAEGYEKKQLWVNLAAYEENNVEFALTPHTGSISLSGSPNGAQVFLDGKYVDKIPCKLKKIMPGTRTITAKKNGYRDWTKKITITSKQVLMLSVHMKPGYFTNSVGMRFIYIKPGSFIMGSAGNKEGRDSDERLHDVTLTNGFYMQTTEVTQRQWKGLIRANPSRFRGDDLPVENVSWNDVQKFIGKLNRREGGNTYRLPTEAEWEYACRAGSTIAFTNGDMVRSGYGHEPKMDEVGWYYENSDSKTHPVKQKKANSWGLFDMHGNVWEWCRDWYGAYPSSPLTDPTGPSKGTQKVFRGGGWFSIARQCRSATRCMSKPENSIANLGFRLVRRVDASP